MMTRRAVNDRVDRREVLEVFIFFLSLGVVDEPRGPKGGDECLVKHAHQDTGYYDGGDGCLQIPCETYVGVCPLHAIRGSYELMKRFFFWSHLTVLTVLLFRFFFFVLEQSQSTCSNSKPSF